MLSLYVVEIIISFMFLSFNGSIALLINTLYSFTINRWSRLQTSPQFRIMTKRNKIPVCCCICQRAVQGGCLGRRCWSVVGSILWWSWIMIAVWRHGAQTSQTYRESVVTSWSSCVPIKSTLCFKIRIHCVQLTYQLSLELWILNSNSHLADIVYIQLDIKSQNYK